MIMLYKLGSMMEWEGKTYDYIVATEEEIEKHLADGWKKTVQELEEVGNEISDEAKELREELEAKAKEFGIKFNHLTKTENLLKKVEEAVGVVD